MDIYESVLREHANQLENGSDLDELVTTLRDKTVVMLGEASHGTEEYYLWRRVLTQRLIEEAGFNFVAVEGDWPESQLLNRFIKTGEGERARNIQMKIHRWPTWMWANEQVTRLIEWMRLNQRAGFYGLDVYSFFESMDEVIKYAEKINPLIAHDVKARYACLDAADRDEMAYAQLLMRFPPGCENEVIENLGEMVRLKVHDNRLTEPRLLDAIQNAKIVVNAERYYRAMFGGGAESWNVRDRHMMETLKMLLHECGSDSKAIVWAHNTHIGDYRATDMAASGYVNLGGLARQEIGNVALVGFGSHSGTVLAGHAWGAPEEVMQMPPARENSVEDIMHKISVDTGSNNLVFLFHDRDELREVRGHRAIGVVYDPQHERRGNYVPTLLSKRYDAFIFIDRSQALKSWHPAKSLGEFPETWPSGF
jgi:erythromycin esterase-like protein